MASERACGTHTPQRLGADGKQAIRQSRQSNGNAFESRSSSIFTRHAVPVGRHPKGSLSQLRSSPDNSSSDSAPGTWGWAGIATGEPAPARCGRSRQPGDATKNSEPTRGTGTEESEDSTTMSARAPGACKELLRTRTSRSKAGSARAMRCSRRATAGVYCRADGESEGAGRSESPGAQAYKAAGTADET